MTYGVTNSGFIPKTVEVIKAEIEASERSSNALGTNVNVSAHTILGQINGIVAGKAAEIWEVAESIYNAHNPDSAVDESLDNLSAICPGISRNEPAHSTVTATLNLDAGITLPAGSIASVVGSSNSRFVTTEDATNPDVVTADVGVTMRSESTGRVYAAAGTLTVIETPFSGWNSITNVLAADPGSDLEQNDELRLRREATIRLAGSTHVDAIRADLLNLDGMLDAVIIENDTDNFVEGLTPHSMQIFIWDGVAGDVADDTIAATIYENKAGGIYTHGNTIETITDTMGFDRDIRFDRVEQLPLYIEIDLLVNAQYAGNNAVITAVQNTAADFRIGQDVYIFRIGAAVAGIDGLVNVTGIRLGWSPAPDGIEDLAVPFSAIAVLQSVEVDYTEE
jgi:uncharacterized phage protein gp47/JayE